MVHFVREHDPKPEPVRLHEDHEASLAALHEKIDWLRAELHSKIEDLAAKVDAVGKASKAVLKEVKD